MVELRHDLLVISEYLMISVPRSVLRALCVEVGDNSGGGGGSGGGGEPRLTAPLLPQALLSATPRREGSEEEIVITVTEVYDDGLKDVKLPVQDR